MLRGHRQTGGMRMRMRCMGLALLFWVGLGWGAIPEMTEELEGTLYLVVDDAGGTKYMLKTPEGRVELQLDQVPWLTKATRQLLQTGQSLRVTGHREGSLMQVYEIA